MGRLGWRCRRSGVLVSIGLLLLASWGFHTVDDSLSSGTDGPMNQNGYICQTEQTKREEAAGATQRVLDDRCGKGRLVSRPNQISKRLGDGAIKKSRGSVQQGGVWRH